MAKLLLGGLIFVMLAAARSAAAPGAPTPRIPTHVQTADYFQGYAGTHSVDPKAAARWLTWAETGVPDSPRLRALGIKTLLYTDPNRTIARQAEYAEYVRHPDAFARDCSGHRIRTYSATGYLMDPHAARLRAIWKEHVDRYASVGHFDAIFEDDADDVLYTYGQPCNYSATGWLDATNAMQRSLGYPIVYNGLANFADGHVSPAIGLNATAIGGMMEQCYAPSPREPKSSGTHWLVTEETELLMMRAHKLFFCYGNDTSPPASALDARLYVYASFLLTYDPAYAVLWEYYGGLARFHVMPESQLVAMRPSSMPAAVSALQTSSGIYERAFDSCYLAGKAVGACIVAVNPDDRAHPLALPGYAKTLRLSGAGILDGGTAQIASAAPPPRLDPVSAVVAFRR